MGSRANEYETRANEFEKWSTEGQQRMKELISTVEAQKSMIEERDAEISDFKRTLAGADNFRAANEKLAAQLETMRFEMDQATSRAMLLAEGKRSLEPSIPEEVSPRPSMRVEADIVHPVRTPPVPDMLIASMPASSSVNSFPVPVASPSMHPTRLARETPFPSDRTPPLSTSSSATLLTAGSTTAREMPLTYPATKPAAGALSAREVPISVSREVPASLSGSSSRDNSARNVDPLQSSTPTSMLGGGVRVMKPQTPAGVLPYQQQPQFAGQQKQFA